jgi:DNA-binding NtrC family response regulator
MDTKKTILVVDDEDDFTHLMEEILRKNNYTAFVARSGADALQILKTSKFDLIILDLIMPELGGLHLLKRVNEQDPKPPVIVLTGDPRVESVVEAMKLGAYDYLSKPMDWNKLEIAVKNALLTKELKHEVIRLKYKVENQLKFENFVGTGPKMREIMERVERVLENDVTVFLEGELGTGKELLARNIHINSPRHEKPFIAVSCSAIPENLLEFELFGYDKGMISGGMAARAGKMEQVNGGTLYLDDIAELPMALQVKLLQLIERGAFQHVGGAGDIPADFRLVIGSTKKLEKEVENGKFREDLYYRINVFPIRIPPLREHIEDIPELAVYFKEKINTKIGSHISRISNDVLSYFMKYDWPGNIQELENVMERSMLNARGNIFQPDDLPITITSFSGEFNNGGSSISLQKAVELTNKITPWKEIEKLVLKHALKISNYNLSTTAAELGIGRTTLYRKLQRYRIKVEKQQVIKN